MEVAQDKYLQIFNKLVNIVAKVANGLKIAALMLLFPTISVWIGSMIYFFNYSDLGNWRWGIPCCVMGLPVLCIVAIWWVLDAITGLPEICTKNSSHISSIVEHHKMEIAEVENRRLSKFKYLSTLGKILYGSTEVMDGVGMISFAATPMFWVLYLISFLGSIVLSCLMIVVCICHYFFMH